MAGFLRAAGTLFACRECGYRSAKWLGRCPACAAWGSLVEEVAERRNRPTAGARAAPVPFPDLPSLEDDRRSCGVAELDRVLGGGLVDGAVVLLGGEPGIGKSTLLLQAAASLSSAGERVLYVSGEESPSQLALRGRRLGASSPGVLVLAETDVDAVVDAAGNARPALLVVDSIQALRCGDLDSPAGSVSQVRESASRFVALAKSSGIPVILVGHVTKDGTLAGPRVLEHVVDTVIQFEGDRHHAFRILRTLKNRFGPTDEIGVFSMTDAGLVAVASPSETFLAERPSHAPGSAVLAAIEGSRPLLVEVQALVGEPVPGTPRRTALGIDAGRLALILAVLSRRAELDLGSRDVFVNVVGGLEIDEPAADLAVALAAASSLFGVPLPEGQVIVGEIGLTGEIRSVSRMEARLREASRLGFLSAMCPEGSPRPPAGLELRPARHIRGALDALARPR